MQPYPHQKLRSRFLYSSAELVNETVLGNTDFDDETFLDLFDDRAKLASPQKFTLLHEVIRNILNFYNDLSTGQSPDMSGDYYREFLSDAEIAWPEWLKADCQSEHISELDRLLEKAVDLITPSIFYILFSDREFLQAFQHRVSGWVTTMKAEDWPDVLVMDGVVRRPKYLPSWLRVGVFHRDKGRCQHCFKDMTGIFSPNIDIHLDHIIPLAAGGSNDPTNFQLACENCNLAKSKKVINGPARFIPYW